MNNIIEIFSYDFMLKALIVGLLISLCASLIGVSLVLRRNSMIGDGLSHVAFGAFSIATVLGFSPLEFALPIVMITSILILKLNENSKIHGDSAIALLSASSLAIGTFIISITDGVSTDINNYLFGSILSIDNKDVVISIILSIIIIILYIISYNKIFAITFDEKFAKVIGIKKEIYNIIFAGLCSIVIVLGMRLMGSLLISSLIIFPTLSAMQVQKKFKNVVIISTAISLISFVLGLLLSYNLEAPTGATIVIVNLMVFLLLKLISYIKGRLNGNN